MKTALNIIALRIVLSILFLTFMISCHKVYTGPGYVVHNDKQAMDFAWRWFEKTEYTEASKMANVALNINPESSDAYTLLGLIHMRLGYYRESVSLLEKSLDLSRKRTAMYSNRITLNNLGYAYISIKAYDKAHKVFYEAYNEKSNPASALGLAISAYNLHDFEEAKDVLKSFLETPNFRSNATKTLKDYNIELDEDTTRFLQF